MSLIETSYEILLLVLSNHATTFEFNSDELCWPTLFCLVVQQDACVEHDVCSFVATYSPGII